MSKIHLGRKRFFQFTCLDPVLHDRMPGQELKAESWGQELKGVECSWNTFYWPWHLSLALLCFSHWLINLYKLSYGIYHCLFKCLFKYFDIFYQLSNRWLDKKTGYISFEFWLFSSFENSSEILYIIRCDYKIFLYDLAEVLILRFFFKRKPFNFGKSLLVKFSSTKDDFRVMFQEFLTQDQTWYFPKVL